MKLKATKSQSTPKVCGKFDASLPVSGAASAARNDLLHRRLELYALAASAAGVSVLALSSPADGRIVYVPDHVKITPGHNLFLDLNHDGVKDFELTDEAAGSSYFLEMNPLHKGNALVEAATDCNPSPGAAAIKAGAVIGRGEVFGDYYCMAQVVDADGSFSLGSWAAGVKNRFLGLRFMINGKKHFGWARFSVSRKPFVATLNGYAYETVANKPIIAGETEAGKTEAGKSEGADQASATPGTPSTGLGALAVGARLRYLHPRRVVHRKGL